MNDQVFYGTPRPLPRVLFCHVPVEWCGRHWIANTVDEYDTAIEERVAHETLCATARGWA